MRRQGGALARYTGHETFDYESIAVEGPARVPRMVGRDAHETHIGDGADRYLIEGGLVTAQTIH